MTLEYVETLAYSLTDNYLEYLKISTKDKVTWDRIYDYS